MSLGPLRTWNPERGTRDLTALLSKLSVSPSVSQKLFVAWLLGVSFLSLRLCVGWWTARRLTRVGVMEPSLEILSHAERIMGALKIQGAVTVLESARRYGIRWLLCLLQPDSAREPRTVEGFPAILHFDEILPEVERIDA